MLFWKSATAQNHFSLFNNALSSHMDKLKEIDGIEAIFNEDFFVDRSEAGRGISCL